MGPPNSTHPSPPTALSPLKTQTSSGARHTHINLKLAISLSVLAPFLGLLIVMAFLKFLRFRMRRHKPNRVVADDYNEKGSRSDDVVGDTTDAACSVRKYSWEEIEKLTMNFSKVIGSGGFSTVYLADHLPDSTNHGAIKILSGSERLNRLFKQELDILLRLQHRNIVKLLGYCDDQEVGALVFEHIPKGSLQENLHGGGGGAVLSWRRRMKIAFQLAQSIEYLHEKCALQIIHGDIKASNILLDDQLNCKLCDFGFAKMGFSSTVVPSMKKQVMMGSPGYTDPHYLRTGLASKKNDVYSFGVIVLELVMGMEAFCSEKGMPLTSIIGSVLGDIGDKGEKMKVAEMVDAKLAGDFDLEEARAMLSISALCLLPSPTFRPSATQILQIMKEKIFSIYLPFSKDQKGSRNLRTLHK